jgi:hypothetical protein
MYKKNLEFQLRLMVNKLGFKIAFTAVLLLSLWNSLYYAFLCAGHDVFNVLASSDVFILHTAAKFNEQFQLYYIYILILPFSFSYLIDAKSKIYMLVQTRGGVKNYYLSKLTASFIGSFIVFFIPFIITILFNQIIFPADGTLIDSIHNLYAHTATITGDNIVVRTVSSGIPFKWLYIYYPQWYNVLYSFFFSCVAGVLGAFVFSISFFIKKFNVFLVLPLFLLTYILNKIDIVIINRAKTYINVNIHPYIMVKSEHGKSLFYIISLLTAMIIITLCLIKRKSSSDQIE